MNTLSIKHTYHPCGTKVEHGGAMPYPELKNYGDIMKEKVLEEIQSQPVFIPIQEETKSA